MNKTRDLLAEDQSVLWHPCSQMKDYETFKPIPVVAARGVNFFLADGSKVIDAISSWWCKNLGHGHPRLTEALIRQANKFEHVILANTTNDNIVDLSLQLTGLTRNMSKIFYASEGSSAVEIALKMAIHARLIRKRTEKNQIACLSNSYHGETLLALAVSDLGLYRQPYEAFLPKVTIINNIPYVTSRQDPLWLNCDEHWLQVEQQLNQLKTSLSILIVEPIVQGAGGMKVYSQDLLAKLSHWCQCNDVYLVVDEIMTSFGRTGPMFAYEYANINPDFICIGKGMTSGFLPMSAVMTTQEIYQLFYDDYDAGKSFLHSHTYSGNALAAAVALENLKIIADEGILEQVKGLEPVLFDAMMMVKDETKKLTNIRYIGGIIAADIITSNPDDRAGFAVFQAAVKGGALLRPLGNTLYWLPPLNISNHEVNQLRDITIRAIIAALQ